MSDSEHPKGKHSDLWGLLLTVAITAIGAAVGYGMLKERVDTLTDQYREHEKKIDDMRRDKSLSDQLEAVRMQLVRIEAQQADTAADVKELKEKRR